MSRVIIFFSSKSISLPGVATTMWQPLEEGWGGRKDGNEGRKMEGGKWREENGGREMEGENGGREREGRGEGKREGRI